MGFDGKRILITGASKGIGWATARHLASLGGHVVALGRNRDDLDALATEIGCDVLDVDLEHPSAAHDAMQAAGPVDLLVNCAGLAIVQTALATSAATFDRVMAVNCRAPMLLSQIYAQDRIGRGLGGAIVNVSSVASFKGTPDHAAYCASKAALDALTRVMAHEWGVHKIRVNGVHPVITLTPMATQVWSDPAKSDPVKARIPLGRFVEPEEVAHAIAYLLSDQAAMISGIDLPVDGGFLIA